VISTCRLSFPRGLRSWIMSVCNQICLSCSESTWMLTPTDPFILCFARESSKTRSPFSEEGPNHLSEPHS
jgi:hypothetical protein